MSRATVACTAVELRILGSLVEKELTTPDNYPLSTNALVAACNQRTNREPVVDYDERTVDTTMLELRSAGLARTVTGGRVPKHRHVLDEVLEIDRRSLSLLAVMMLRGPQTVGELRIRTERMADFVDLGEIEATLGALAASEVPLVERLERRPGQKEARWRHLLALPGEADETGAGDPGSVSGLSSAPPSSPASSRHAGGQMPSAATDELWAEIRRLRADVDRLYALLGESPDTPDPAGAPESPGATFAGAAFAGAAADGSTVEADERGDDAG